MSELIPIFDGRGQFTGAVPRPDLYNRPENNHQVVHNLIYLPLELDMEPERMWAQVRSEQSAYLPGYIVTTAGGHVNMDPSGVIPESPEEAMWREDQEEIFQDSAIPADLSLTRLGGSFFFKPSYTGYNGGIKEVTTFVSQSDGKNFRFAPSEVANILPIPVGELKEMARDESTLLHPEFRQILNKKMVRIGIVGTYSAGKTTLTEALSQKISGAAAIKEDVRHYVREGFHRKGIQELSPDEFILLEHMLYRDQKLGPRSADIAIIDSTPIGCPVYVANYGELAGNGYKFDETTIQAWITKTRDTLLEYDVIVYLPPEIPFENDGFRTPPKFRAPIDEGFRALVEGHPRLLEVTGYVPGNVQAGVEQRVNTILDYVTASGLVDPSLIQ